MTVSEHLIRRKNLGPFPGPTPEEDPLLPGRHTASDILECKVTLHFKDQHTILQDSRIWYDRMAIEAITQEADKKTARGDTAATRKRSGVGRMPLPARLIDRNG